jgi:hypothetical protein
VELRSLADSGDVAGFADLLAARDDAWVRRSFAAVHATWLALEARAPAALRVATWTRLAELAPPAEQSAMRLALGQAQLDAGDAESALRQALALSEEDPAWGDARWLLARALDVAGEPAEAAVAWRTLVQGLPAGSERWREASAGWLGALERAGDPAAACRVARSVQQVSGDDAPTEIRRRVARCDAGDDGDQGAGKP